MGGNMGNSVALKGWAVNDDGTKIGFTLAVDWTGAMPRGVREMKIDGILGVELHVRDRFRKPVANVLPVAADVTGVTVKRFEHLAVALVKCSTKLAQAEASQAIDALATMAHVQHGEDFSLRATWEYQPELPFGEGEE